MPSGRVELTLATSSGDCVNHLGVIRIGKVAEGWPGSWTALMKIANARFKLKQCGCCLQGCKPVTTIRVMKTFEPALATFATILSYFPKIKHHRKSNQSSAGCAARSQLTSRRLWRSPSVNSWVIIPTPGSRYQARDCFSQFYHPNHTSSSKPRAVSSTFVHVCAPPTGPGYLVEAPLASRILDEIDTIGMTRQRKRGGVWHPEDRPKVTLTRTLVHWERDQLGILCLSVNGVMAGAILYPFAAYRIDSMHSWCTEVAPTIRSNASATPAHYCTYHSAAAPTTCQDDNMFSTETQQNVTTKKGGEIDTNNGRYKVEGGWGGGRGVSPIHLTEVPTATKKHVMQGKRERKRLARPTRHYQRGMRGPLGNGWTGSIVPLLGGEDGIVMAQEGDAEGWKGRSYGVIGFSILPSSREGDEGGVGFWWGEAEVAIYYDGLRTGRM
ncbi:hypothetical protein BD779DRAFT_1477796 [Infundibulicybe gibba]|nr:hypothetical protein BD779DRAFT_1477796 [Infundibulicybe gibba]